MNSRLIFGTGRFFTSNAYRGVGGVSGIGGATLGSLPRVLRSSLIPHWSAIAKKPITFNKSSFRNYPTWRDLGSKSQNGSSWGSRQSNNSNGYQQLVAPFGFFVATSIGMYYGFPYLFKIPPFTVFNQNPQLLVYAIIAANVGVFFAWQLPRFHSLLSKHFLLQKPLRSYTSMIGSAFSHQESWHLGFNMLMLYSFGGSFAAAVGPSFFLFMYCSSAIFSSFVSLAWPVVARMSFMAPSLGASGALFSLFSTVAYLFPKTQLSVMFIPFPGGAWTALLAFTALNAAGLVLRWGSMDYAAHLGGTIIGVFFGKFLSDQKKKKRQNRSRAF